jgi:hypothetical protein
MKDIMGRYVADKGIAQFRCAETEKFPHVTFFFNDYREEPFPGEDRSLIPSPKEGAPTTRSRDERLRHQGLDRAGDPEPHVTASSWSTSPMPTWLATLARFPRRPVPARLWMMRGGNYSRRSMNVGDRALVTDRPRQQ